MRLYTFKLINKCNELEYGWIVRSDKTLYEMQKICEAYTKELKFDYDCILCVEELQVFDDLPSVERMKYLLSID